MQWHKQCYATSAMQHRTRQRCRYKTTHTVGHTVWWILRHIYRTIWNTPPPRNQTQNWTVRSTTTNKSPQIIPNELSWAWQGQIIVGHPICKGLDSPQHLAIQSSNIISQEKGWYYAHVYWLPFLKSKHSCWWNPIQWINGILDRLHGSAIFSKLDLA